MKLMIWWINDHVQEIIFACVIIMCIIAIYGAFIYPDSQHKGQHQAEAAMQHKPEPLIGHTDRYDGIPFGPKSKDKHFLVAGSAITDAYVRDDGLIDSKSKDINLTSLAGITLPDVDTTGPDCRRSALQLIDTLTFNGFYREADFTDTSAVNMYGYAQPAQVWTIDEATGKADTLIQAQLVSEGLASVNQPPEGRKTAYWRMLVQLEDRAASKGENVCAPFK